MNAGEMKTAVKRFGFDDADPLLTWINAALHDLEDAANWTFLEEVSTLTTVVGSPLLPAMPPNLELIHSLKIVGQTDKLTYLSRTAWEANIQDESTPGIPTHFTMVGLDEVILWPVPDAAYSVRMFYHKTITELVADGDNPLTMSGVPLKLHFPVVQRAVAIGHQADDSDDTTAQSQYEAAVGAASTSLAGEHQSASFGQVQDAQEYG